MRVLHFQKIAIAQSSPLRLHKGLLKLGVESIISVAAKSIDHEGVMAPTIAERLFCILHDKIDNLSLNKYPNKDQTLFSASLLFPGKHLLQKKIDCINPSIVHLHWISEGLMQIGSIKNISRPIIWTLHDSWAFTGGCHVPFNCSNYKNKCGSCMKLGSEKENDLSMKVLQKKSDLWKEKKIILVAPSTWMAKCALSSSLFKSNRVEVIPNGLDLNIFKNIEKNVARDILSLPQDKKLILFGAMNSTSDKNKGFHFLKSAINYLSENKWGDKAELIVFGANKPDNPIDMGLTCRYIGKLFDEISLSILYSAADIMIVPSIQESFGQTAIEAMACGTPVVAFNTTGLKDIIDHKENGYLAEPYECYDLANGIIWALNDAERLRNLSYRARDKVAKYFDIARVSQMYLKLYNDVLLNYHR